MSENVVDQHSKDPEDITALLNDLRDRAKNILSELETFKDHLKSIRLESTVETAHFHGQLRSELGMLERLAAKTPEQSSYHIAKSSNLPFLETVWNTAKSQHRLLALQKRFYYPRASKADIQSTTSQESAPRRRRRGRTGNDASCIVDVIVDSGRTWYKISLVSNNRLLFELAKQGWEVGESDSEGNGSSTSSHRNAEEDLLPIVKTARELALASQTTRVHTKHPTVKLILPRVVEGKTKEIDLILADCRSAGVEIICQPAYRPSATPLQQVLDAMAPSPFTNLTDRLNIDCTILLALVSEFSHAKVSKEPWFHTALQRQVEIEGNENLLPSLLYPAMGSRKLVCTRIAAQRMQEIVDTIGTVSEKARTAILMGSGDVAGKAREELVEEMQAWSAYTVPADWQLPIAVVDFDASTALELAQLPGEAAGVCRGMTAINRSIFLFGWTEGVTTITSNRTVVKQIESEFDKFDNVDDASWPKIWLCPTARSLVGKEKRSVKKAQDDGEVPVARPSRSKKDGVMPLPDPLRRENQRRNGLDVLSLREGHDVEDLRPEGYDYSDVIQAKNEARYQTK